MARRIGGVASRELVGGYAVNQIGEDIQRGRMFGESPTLQRAVVVDVIMDPNILSSEQLEAIRNTVNNPRFANIMPVNSIIARMVSDSQGRMARTNTILFPFFSSHFLLPVQAGEVVEVIYDDYSSGGKQIGYWMTRTSTERTIEDPNYTHLDRRFQPFNNPANFTTEQRNNRSEDQPVPSFPNGGNTNDTFTLVPSGGMERPYERIITNASSYFGNQEDRNPIVTPEPVPRWRKRPQEFVLQGANNTLICLGEDRKGDLLGAVQGETLDAKGSAGTIDVVAGRGRILPEDNQDPSDVFPGNTAPFITTNERSNRETYKTPYLNRPGTNKLEDNPREGDPDFQRDAARLYITMQSEVDNNFGVTRTEFTENSLPHGDSKNEIPQPSEGQAGSLNKSYVVGKADHIRVIARKDEDNGVEGTVLILREGTSEEDLCHLYINKDGVHVDGPKIILGRGLAEVASPDSDPTPGGEPYIRWSKFRDTVTRLQEEMDVIKNSLIAQIQETETQLQNTRSALATAFQTSNCVPYSPDPALTTAAAQLQPAAGQSPAGSPNMAGPGIANDPERTSLDSNLNSARDSTSQDVDSSQSKKIFGE